MSKETSAEIGCDCCWMLELRVANMQCWKLPWPCEMINTDKFDPPPSRGEIRRLDGNMLQVFFPTLSIMTNTLHCAVHTHTRHTHIVLIRTTLDILGNLNDRSPFPKIQLNPARLFSASHSLDPPRQPRHLASVSVRTPEHLHTSVKLHLSQEAYFALPR